MNQRLYCVVTGSIFIVIALLHLFRIVYGWKVAIGPWTAPGWMAALVVAGYLGYEGIRLAKRLASSVNGGKQNRFGVINAFTNAAQRMTPAAADRNGRFAVTLLEAPLR